MSVSDADVWRMKTCSSPTCSRRSSGSASSTSRVIRWKPRGRGPRVISRWTHMRAYGIRAARMSTFSPRNGTPSASSSARWRAPLASEPSARTIRHHGSVGSSLSDAARCRRSAARRARRRRRRARSPRGSRGPARAPPRVLSSAAMRHGTYSIVALDPATGELGVAVQSHWFSVGPLCAWARAGVGAVATQSVVEPAYGPNALDRLAGGRQRPAGARRAARRRPAAPRVRQVAVIDVARRRSASTPARTASRTPATSAASTTAARRT